MRLPPPEKAESVMALYFSFTLHERDFDRNAFIGYSLFLATTNPVKD
jgi:hypothetical protein